jgi:hypothetical protein
MGFWPRATGRRLAEENKTRRRQPVLPRTLRSAGGMPSAASSAACSSAGGACLSAARNGGAGADGSECERRRGGAGRTKGRSEYHAPIRVVVRPLSCSVSRARARPLSKHRCCSDSSHGGQERAAARATHKEKWKSVRFLGWPHLFVFSLRQRTTAAHPPHPNPPAYPSFCCKPGTRWCVCAGRSRPAALCVLLPTFSLPTFCLFVESPASVRRIPTITRRPPLHSTLRRVLRPRPRRVRPAAWPAAAA